jgi:hypothetical protein
MTTLAKLTEICETCGFENSTMTDAENGVHHETALSLTEVMQIHLNYVFIEILEFEHENERDTFTVFVGSHESAIFENQQVGAQFVAAFKFVDKRDAIACAENIYRAVIETY